MADKEEFYLKEYESLRKEIEWLSGEVRLLERNVAVAVALIWVWLLKYGGAWKAAWFIPVLLAFLGAVRALQIERQFERFNAYICKIEKFFSDDSQERKIPGGWESFLQEQAKGKRAKGKRPYSLSAIVFWLALLLSTISAAFYKLFSK